MWREAATDHLSVLIRYLPEKKSEASHQHIRPNSLSWAKNWLGESQRNVNLAVGSAIKQRAKTVETTEHETWVSPFFVQHSVSKLEPDRTTVQDVVWPERNKTSHGLLRDLAYIFHQGILYFLNIIRFYGTRINVILFKRGGILRTEFKWPVLLHIRELYS